jgi:lia operon protein LiaG
MRKKALPSLALAGALALGLLSLNRPSEGSLNEPTRHTISGAEVAIYNLLGTLEVVRGDGPSVVAEVTFHGKDAVRLKVENGPIEGRQTLRVIYPGDRIVAPEFGDHTTSTFRVNEDGTFRHEKRGGRRVVISGRGPGIEAGADMRLLVPPGKKVSVDWGHGKATVTRIDADLTLDAASMPVIATGIRGSLHVDIGSGMVRVEGADAEISIDTGSGDVSLAGIRARGVDVDTGSGEVTVEILGETRSLEIESGSGDVSVTIPKTLGADLSIETGSGRIETNLTLETSVRKHDVLVGRIGDGQGRIAIETASGTVSIRQAGL